MKSIARLVKMAQELGPEPDPAALRRALQSAGYPLELVEAIPSDLPAVLAQRDWSREELGKALLEASRRGQVPAVIRLLEAGAPVDFSDEDGWTALRAAAVGDQSKTIKLLVKEGAPVNARDARGRTALMEAAYLGHCQAVRALLAAGADPNLATADGATAVADTDCCDCVLALVQGGSEIQVKRARSTTWPTLLEMAASKGRMDLMKELVERGAEPTGAALLAAARGGWTEAVEWLLENGARLDGRNGAGETPLMGAVGEVELVSRMLELGADPEAVDVNGHSALHKAVSRDNLAAVRRLLEALSRPPVGGALALSLAASLGRTAILEALLGAGPGPEERGAGLGAEERGASLGPEQREAGLGAEQRGAGLGPEERWAGQTPLMAAAVAGQRDTLRWLVARGADLETRDDQGRTALALAVCCGQLETAEELLRAGARLEAADGAGLTALMLAAGTPAAARSVPFLLSAGADRLARDRDGHSAALHAASYWKLDRSVLEALLEEGPDPSEVLSQLCHLALRTTLRSAALDQARISAIEALLERGASPREEALLWFSRAMSDERLDRVLLAHGVDQKSLSIEVPEGLGWWDSH